MTCAGLRISEDSCWHANRILEFSGVEVKRWNRLTSASHSGTTFKDTEETRKESKTVNHTSVSFLMYTLNTINYCPHKGKKKPKMKYKVLFAKRCGKPELSETKYYD